MPSPRRPEGLPNDLAASPSVRAAHPRQFPRCEVLDEEVLAVARSKPIRNHLRVTQKVMLAPSAVNPGKRAGMRPCAPSAVAETNRMAPVARFLTNTSGIPFTSVGTRSDRAETKASSRPSGEYAGSADTSRTWMSPCRLTPSDTRSTSSGPVLLRANGATATRRSGTRTGSLMISAATATGHSEAFGAASGERTIAVASESPRITKTPHSRPYQPYPTTYRNTEIVHAIVHPAEAENALDPRITNTDSV